MTERPVIRRASAPLVLDVEVWDYLHGEKFKRKTRVYIYAEEWLNQKTNRYRRMYTAREADRLGGYLGSTPRRAILGAINPVQKRGGWIADACRQAEALKYR